MKSLDPSQEHLQGKPKMPAIIKPREIVNVPGVKGTLPLRAGEVILTPDEVKRLKAIGWKPGDPIPGNLPEYLRAFNQIAKQMPEDIQQEILTTPPVPLDTPATKFPEPIDISQLDPAKRAEIEEYLSEFKKHAPQIEQAVKLRSGMEKINPSVQKAIVAAEDDGVELVDSRISESAEDLQKKIDIAEGKRQSNKVEEQKQEEVDNTEYGDKVNYLTSIMAAQPFRKMYSLYGGCIVYGFRQLTTVQTEMILKQVSYEARSGLVDTAECVRLGHLYWALLSLDFISINNYTTEYSSVSDTLINNYSGDTPPTPLQALVELLKNDPLLKNGTHWHTLQVYGDKFTKLIETLEAKADSPDFWSGIEV